MPIDHDHNAELDLLMIRMHGDISDEDLFEYARLAVEDDRVGPATNDYIDLGGVTSISLTSAGLRRMNRLLERGGRTRNPGRMAIWAPTDAPYGMSRVFQADRDGGPIEVSVFRDEREARRWIGLLVKEEPDPAGA